MSMMTQPAPRPAREARFAGGVAALAPGRLYALQNPFVLDGRVSSYAASARGFSVANSYLLIEPDAAGVEFVDNPRFTHNYPHGHPTIRFTDVEVEPWRVYQIDDARSFLSESGLDVDRLAPVVKDTFVSAFVRARKPETASCCGPTCCATCSAKVRTW